MQEILRNCRCCLKSPSSDYFNEFVDFNKNVDHSQKIVELFESLTSIKVDFNDLDNSKICRDCLEKLKSSYEFREMCLSSNKSIEEKIFKLNPLRFPEFVEVKLEVKDEEEIREESYIVLEDGEIKTESFDFDFFEKGSEVHLNGEESFLCEGRTNELSEFVEKNDTKKVKITARKVKEKITSTKKSVTERSKKIKGSNITKGKKSSKIKGNGTSEIKSYNCSFCNKAFPAKQNCTNHEKIVHIREMKFTCDVCDRKFMMKGQLRMHLFSHFNIKNHKCEICSRGFCSKQEKINHEKYFHKLVEKTIPCPYCDQMFSHKRNMEVHSKIHTNDNPFKCEFEGCDKAYRVKAFLRQHAKTHLQDTFECDICGIKLKSIHTHRFHKRQHELEAANIVFPCDVCSKTFKRSSSLWSHKKNVHSTVKAFQCPHCEKRYPMRSKLTCHIICSHNHNRFTCELCPTQFKLKRFFQKAYLTHIEKKHTELNAEELENFRVKIKKLKFTDLATNFRNSIPDLYSTMKCPNCNLKFTKIEQLESHLKLCSKT